MDQAAIHEVWQRLRDQVGQVVIGQEEILRLMFVALLTEGHLLLEGNPGTGKTLMARSLAASLRLQFRRIQFTPDLMPGDVAGANLFDFQTNRFTLVKGPIFTEFLLADEINRTPPKTQSALLEAMQERSVTLDGVSHSLPPAFMVVATQNPIEHEGTYPLPEAQLDRFLFKVLVPFPEREAEIAMVQIHGHRTAMPRLEDFSLQPLIDGDWLQQARSTVSGLRLAEPMVAYVVDLVRATRNHPAVLFGASPRAANMLATASRAIALLEGRDYVIPDDLQRVYLPALRHRIVLSAGAQVEGRGADDILSQILEQVPAPR